MQRIFPLIAALLLACTAPMAQELVRTVHYSTTNGMLSDVTYSGMFDRNNYLWICTDRGLSRFDGTHFTHFTIDEGLPDNDIVYVSQDDEGNIWARPFQREVAFLEPNKSVFTNINTIIPADTVSEDKAYRVFQLKQNVIGLLAPSGVVRVIRKKKWIGSYQLPFTAGAWNIVLYADEQDRLVAIRTGLTVTLQADGTWLQQPNDFKISRFEQVNGKSILQVNGENTLVFFDPRNAQTEHFRVGIDVKRFGVFRKGVLAGDDFRNIAFTSYATGKTAPDPLKALVSYAAENADGSVQAIFTADEGIYVRTFDPQHEYRYLNKTPYYFYRDRNTLKAADAFQIIFPNVSPMRIRERPPTIPIFAESFGTTEIVYGTEPMLYRSGKRVAQPGVPAGIKDVYMLNDSIRYFASFNGVYVFNTNSLSSRKLYPMRSTAVSAGPRGSVFIGTHWGLMELKQDGTIVEWTKNGRFPYVRITDILCRNNVVWVATAGKGLIAICNDRVTPILTDRNGVSRNVITAIGEDADRNLFIGYYDGAQKLTYTMRGNVPVVQRLVILETYKDEGIRSLFFWKGKMYALGNRGVFIFNSGKVPLKQFRLRITRIAVNDELRDLERSYWLESGDYDFLISFSTINFEQFPVRYRYRINKGIWHYTSDNEIRYKNLSWGTYTICIQVLDNYCRPSDTQVVTFDVSPPFFRKTGFLVFTGIVLVVLISLLARYWFRKKYTEKNAYLVQQNKLNELELMALKAQINPHFVFNCLNSIKALIYQNELEEADTYIDRFAALFRNTLEASLSSWHRVADEIAYLETYLEMERTSVKGRFDFSIELLPPADPNTLYIPTMLLQPYVENAVKHGMTGLRDRKGEIRIRFEQTAEKLICTVTDNGPGIGIPPVRRSPLHTGKGIAITEKRAQLYQTETRITDNIPSGTVVMILVPKHTIRPTDDHSTAY